MTLDQIRDELALFRFNASQTMSQTSWVNMRYLRVWGAAEWPWRIVPPTAVTVVGSTSTAAVPADFHRPLALYDNNGFPLDYVARKDFQDTYRGDILNGVTGTPQHYTMFNNAIYLGPTPSASYTFTLSYLKRITHFNASVTEIAGVMSADTDYPTFPVEYHYMLVLGAMATGLKMENDPTWMPLEEEFRDMLDLMRNDFLPADQAGNQQYGALPWPA